MINATDTVTLCIGGRIFVTRRSTLYRVPDSRLYMIAIKHEKQFSQSSKICSSSHDHGGVVCSSSSMPSDAPIYYFDRDPEIFRFVLDFYRTGELHLPNSICGPFVRKELIFWGIDESFIGPCCMSAYMRYDEEKRTKKTLFKDCFEDIDSMKNLVKYCRGLKRLRYRLWLFFDHPSSSLLAKLWAMLLLLLMILSVTCHCLSTHEAFRMPLKNLTFYTNSAICTFEKINSNPKFHKDCTSEPRYDLAFLDVALNVLFTLEFLFKLMLAPDKIKFISSFVSMLDICILFSYWVYAIIFYKLYYYPKNHTSEPINRNILWFLNTMSMTQALRILRIFKVSKISRGLRVLILTIKKSIPELVLLAFLLMNGMFFFSCCIYVAEYWVDDTFNSIPQAFWWTIVTLTTVGYGDSYPKQGPGYFVGSITAICGCILTGLAIPIIGNNFNTYYMYMKNQIKEDKYIKELQKDLTSLTSTLRTSNIKKLAALRDGKSHQCNIVMKRKLTRANCPLTTPVLSLEIANASLKMIAKGAKTKKKKNLGKFLKIKTYDSLYKRNFPNNKIPEPEKSNFNDLTEFDPSLPIRPIHRRENYV